MRRCGSKPPAAVPQPRSAERPCKHDSPRPSIDLLNASASQARRCENCHALIVERTQAGLASARCSATIRKPRLIQFVALQFGINAETGGAPRVVVADPPLPRAHAAARRAG